MPARSYIDEAFSLSGCLEAVDEAAAAVDAALVGKALHDVGGTASEEAAGRQDAAAAGEAALAEAAPVNEGHAVLTEDVAGDGLLEGHRHSDGAGDDESENEQDLQARRHERTSTVRPAALSEGKDGDDCGIRNDTS